MNVLEFLCNIIELWFFYTPLTNLPVSFEFQRLLYISSYIIHLGEGYQRILKEYYYVLLSRTIRLILFSHSVHTYIHSYVHTYIHTYRYSYVHAYIHTYTYRYSYIHTYIHTYIVYMYVCMYVCMNI